jgi:hypothetical protein
MLKNIDNQATDGEEKSKPEVIKLGLDLHVRQVTECRQLDGSTPKPAQQWDPWRLLDKVEEWVKAGIKVYSCYEAGPCGYWYHRELTKRGAVDYVVAPRLLENQRFPVRDVRQPLLFGRHIGELLELRGRQAVFFKRNQVHCFTPL